MDFGEVMGVVLPIVYVVLGVALVWFVIELVITVRKTRTTVDKMKEQLDPTLESVQRITKSLEPAMDKVDPLVDRVSLTVDAANLEIMRLDQILEDVSDITDSASNAVGVVEAATNAPMEIMNNVTSKVREKLKSKHASDESVALGEAKAKAQAAALAGAPDEGDDAQGGTPSKAQANDDDAPQRVQPDDRPEQPAYFTYAPQGNDSSQER
ncbi:hypothetical protein [uncultured Senegalimassilia sp.]|uniref:hypothetical protein n=1 Tax=uncultured Senegalimassilia sp. TaxID=1714350 RepID=UPI0025E6D445|nr:hypothetical protein [uncultured Senegalimassilia sp.]